jgi:hypothetical protein
MEVRRMRASHRIVLLLVLTVFVPAMAFAQASITGTVRDTSGAVLPGVTVEAASPALIEKVRSVVTDGNGQYRIVDLRPGDYTVTFTLPGFSTTRRDGVTLEGALTATINADLRVGSLEETVTVTGESPIVDVQSIRRQTVVDGETINELPVTRSYGALFQLNPSVTTGAGTNQNIQIVPAMQVFGGFGGRANEGRLQVDGLNVGAALNGGGVSSYVADVGNSQEVAFTTSGGLGEAEVGGPSVSIVPKTGGNSVKGGFYVASVRDWMVGSNIDDDLRARGLATGGEVIKLWDYNLGIGGPIVRDKLWYYGSVRDEGAHVSIPGMFANANAGDPTKTTYVADLNRPARQAGSWRIYNLRLTSQANPKNRFNAYWDEQRPCEGGAADPDNGDACRAPESGYVIAGATGASSGATGATNAPETATYRGPNAYGYGEWQRVQQGTWTSTATNKLLLEAGLGTYMSRWGGNEMPGNPTKGLVRVVEQCPAATGCDANGGIAGLTYRSANYASNEMKNINWRGSASYVTGTHSMKFGYQGHYHITNDKNFTNSQNLAFRVANGIPNQITENLLGAYTVQNRTRLDAFYAQEQWTRNRWTFSGALRFDYARSHFPEQTIDPTRFLPSGATLPEAVGVTGFKDFSPRGGAAWDVFGTGKTAVKLNVGKYLEAATNQALYTATNPFNRMQLNTTRTWTDANGNFAPDCDLLNPALQDARGTGGDFCAAIADVNFGGIRPTDEYDPNLLGGWSVRPADWQIGASVQQEILPRVSVEVGYTRRWLTNFQVTDNQARSVADYQPFAVAIPTDPRLPGGGGGTITGIFDPVPAVANLTSNYVTLAKNYGDYSQVYNGVLINGTARTRNGLTLQGGFNAGKTDTDLCDVRSLVPELAVNVPIGPTAAANSNNINAVNPYCAVSTGWATRFTGLATYTIPKADVSVATTFRSDQGVQLGANNVYTSAQVQESLGRPLSNNAPNVTINLIEPGTLYGDRINNVDMRFAKILRFGRTRTNVGVDVYNVFNWNPVLTYNNTFGSTWLRPTSILSARFMKISAQVDF